MLPFDDPVTLAVGCMGHKFNEQLMCNRPDCAVSWSGHQSTPGKCGGLVVGGNSQYSTRDRAIAGELYRRCVLAKGTQSIPQVGASMGMGPDKSRRAYDRARRWMVGVVA